MPFTAPKEPLNILLVDDQPAKLLSYESVLGDLGERLVRANSGNQALELLLRDDYAVVLVDVVMPELDGFELARMIRSHPRFQRTAIILVSGVMVEDAYRLKGYDSGAVDYISVPIVPEILRAKVSIFTELYRKSRELERLNQELELRVAERSAQFRASAAEAEAARREAERANQLKDEFLATLSHELRTPLNAITGWTHLLQSGSLSPDDQLKAVETISRNAQAQARLMADLLDVSRIVNGKLRLELASVDLVSVAQAALDGVRPTAEEKRLNVRAELAEALPPVHGDATRLQQVIWNLLSNAVKFTPAGGEVEIALRADGADSLVLTVQDTGPGIPESFLPYIFERFRQSDQSSTRSQRGLGLGLTIVRHLVESHGGAVTAANRTDRAGARFVATIPAVAEATAVKAAPKAQERISARALQHVQVLVVDDEADAREVVARLLEAHGAEVQVAASASEAMTLLQRDLPSLVVTDIEMPGEDGYALVRKIRALPKRRGGSLPVVALTAYAGAQDRLRLLEAGFQEHVPKPVEAPVLVRTAARVAQPDRRRPATAKSRS